MSDIELVFRIFGIGIVLFCISFLVLGIMVSSAINEKLTNTINSPIDSIINTALITEEFSNLKNTHSTIELEKDYFQKK
ncbi:MAG: hypothetical protein J7K00_05355 [Candidatus Diapherotrites archaeon]|nr:hypothetical protein [Candidatus Diapherotrites archaeon]